ncbi:gap junction delta-2 protein-like [Engraulis encrasicolus]|uniref:gap junction delta-2 protein-like n=1 Tax=Engraulis encrasicolus TaxID=184585 RepID=UPI002FD107CE
MGDWSILGRFLAEVQNHSTVIGKIWLTVLLIFRILLVALVGDAVYSDEQSKFTCNTLQPGCSNVCYDTFAPVSHLRFWVFQIIMVSTPSIFYIVYVLNEVAKDEKLEIEMATREEEEEEKEEEEKEKRKVMTSTRLPICDDRPTAGEEWEEETRGDPEGECVEQRALEEVREEHQGKEEVQGVRKDPTELSNQVLLIYIIHVVLSSIMEISFLVGQCCLFGFEVPQLFWCKTYPCPNRTACFVSRATEKTIFLNFMFSISLGCFVLNMVELHYLGWVYIFRVLSSSSSASTCSSLCAPPPPPILSPPEPERLGVHQHQHHPLCLKHSLQGRVVLQAPVPMPVVQTRSCSSMTTPPPGANPRHPVPTISFQSDATLQCRSIQRVDERENRKGPGRLAMLGRGGGRSWQ